MVVVESDVGRSRSWGRNVAVENKKWSSSPATVAGLSLLWRLSTSSVCEAVQVMPSTASFRRQNSMPLGGTEGFGLRV